MKSQLEIGPTPSDEPAAQVGTGYYERAPDECHRFIALIREKLGVEPDGARLKVKGSPHDFGRYYEVVVEFDDDNPTAVEYAYMVERKAPATW